jgi:hypothetical protein
VLTPSRVEISNPPIHASLEFNDGLIGICVEVIVYDGFGAVQTAA